LTTKIHTLTDAQGRPLRFILTAGEAHDSTTAADLLADRTTTGVIADKAYDNNTLRELIGNSQAEAIDVAGLISKLVTFEGKLPF
jgi:transposase